MNQYQFVIRVDIGGREIVRTVVFDLEMVRHARFPEGYAELLTRVSLSPIAGEMTRAILESASRPEASL